MESADSPLTFWIRLAFVLLAIVVLGFCLVPFDPYANTGLARRTKALAHARQIHLALHEYAIDYDGAFPKATTNANAAYRQLFDRRFQDERIFFVHGCAWHQGLPSGQTRPDNDVGQPPAYESGLERGENHWAYVSGLNNESPGNLPIVADGFSKKIGVYSEDPMERGGVWDGEVAIVVRIDGSGKMEKIRKDRRVKEKVDRKWIDIFSKEYGTDPTKILNPW